ncbi:hypothetical protein J2X83_003677 [Brevibacillus nitrificans]|nr:hypothetical protein [Brevibacillus nitrificans]
MRRKELLDPWNHASVKVMDVRHQIVQPMEVFSYSSLPSSVYVYAVRGQAEVMLDQLVHPVFGCDVMTAEKGLPSKSLPRKRNLSSIFFSIKRLFLCRVIRSDCGGVYDEGAASCSFEGRSGKCVSLTW